MKKLFVVLSCALFLASCGGTLNRSEYLEHNTMYKSWDHAKFSWFGHRNITPEELEKSQEQQWWGTDVPYVPGQ